LVSDKLALAVFQRWVRSANEVEPRPHKAPHCVTPLLNRARVDDAERAAETADDNAIICCFVSIRVSSSARLIKAASFWG